MGKFSRQQQPHLPKGKGLYVIVRYECLGDWWVIWSIVKVNTVVRHAWVSG